MRQDDAGTDVDALRLDAVSVAYLTQHGPAIAVNSASLVVRAGSSLGIVGESGCGKTTLGLALLRLLPETARVDGRVELVGRDLYALTEHELHRVRWSQISHVPQNAMAAFNPLIRIGKQIASAILLHDPEVTSRSAMARAAGLLTSVGISSDRITAYPHELSGGMKQRAAIALALACHPAVVLADEPTTALDVVAQATVLQLLRARVMAAGAALVLISHDLGVVSEVCEQVAVMYAGRVVERGAMSDVMDQPRHPYTRALVGAYPSLTGPRQTLEGIPGSPPAPESTSRNWCEFAPRCPLAQQICWERAPEDVGFDNGQMARCHFAAETVGG